ncbi:tripartite tricarboxylate transporter substrate binding protein [Aquincola sp. MAHUQ-54]|uniref:Tripartite tricarboxylate transporter substrate binding protein n=1 Tax=Aquincola agrisoli TaxID=3119538 RepID=A0AAW9QEC9_9BURK
MNSLVRTPARRRVAAAVLGGLMALTCGLARAADYPDKTIRMVVPFPPGGATDNVSRLIAKSMSENLGQTIYIENRGGAGAMIGAEAVAKADPDGYTVLSSTAGVHIVNPAIYAKLPYDPVKSFVPVGQIISAPLVMVVRADSPFKTAQDLIAYAKKHPGKLTYGSAGNGTSLHQSGEMFKDAAGVDLLHVPYKGAGPAVNDFLGGQVDIMFSYVGSVLPQVKAGKTRMLAIGSPQRLPIIQDVPTVAEVTGHKGYDADTWTGLAVPAGTPPAIVQRLHQALAFALEKNREQLVASGYVVLGGSPDAMAQRIATELKTVTPLLARVMGPMDNK